MNGLTFFYNLQGCATHPYGLDNGTSLADDTMAGNVINMDPYALTTRLGSTLTSSPPCNAYEDVVCLGTTATASPPGSPLYCTP